MTKVLIVGSTGTVGSLVLEEVLRRGTDARVLVRDEQRAAHLPAHVERHVGDLGDPEAVRGAMKGVQAAFYIPPHEPDEVRLGTSFVRAGEEAGIRLVLAGTHISDPQMRAAFVESMPAYRGKLEVSTAFAASTANPVVIALANYNQNDEIFKEDILNGVYPTPIKRSNRIDLRDMAELAATALIDPAFPSGEYALIGPESFTGAEAAEIWAAELGRPVTYVDGDGEWQAIFGKRLAEQKLEDWISSFVLLKNAEFPTDPAQVQEVTRLLGHAPRDYRSYVRETARLWKSQERSAPPATSSI
ncbi:SDR family oxidoreductase [Streptosporangium sp. NPDC000095]|uniref:SDR family oxidoreductase n=1 Tax=Streptosporangium sp. NPDC000095 TaxID=3366184 RepID=UPI00367E3AF4